MASPSVVYKKRQKVSTLNRDVAYIPKALSESLSPTVTPRIAAKQEEENHIGKSVREVGRLRTDLTAVLARLDEFQTQLDDARAELQLTRTEQKTIKRSLVDLYGKSYATTEPLHSAFGSQQVELLRDSVKHLLVETIEGNLTAEQKLDNATHAWQATYMRYENKGALHQYSKEFKQFINLPRSNACISVADTAFHRLPRTAPAAVKLFAARQAKLYLVGNEVLLGFQEAFLMLYGEPEEDFRCTIARLESDLAATKARVSEEWQTSMLAK